MKKDTFETDIGYFGAKEWIAGVPGKHVLETRRGGDMTAIDTPRGRVFNVAKKTFVSVDVPSEDGGILRKITEAPFKLLSVGKKK